MTEDKTGLPAWSPATYERGKPRAVSSVLAVSALVLDYDGGATLEHARASWEPWPHVGHTSWSHSDDKPKCRIVVPFERPIPATGWARVWAWAKARAPEIDDACKDPSRLYFLPFGRDGRDGRARDAWRWEEPAHLLNLDWRALPDPTPKPAAPPLPWLRPRSQTRDARGALRTDPGARQRVAHALGARIVGEGDGARAKGITCPACGRPSVWFPLNPRSLRGAACDHRNSCGWVGWLDQLVHLETA